MDGTKNWYTVRTAIDIQRQILIEGYADGCIAPVWSVRFALSIIRRVRIRRMPER